MREKKINQSSNCQSQKTNSNKLKQTQQPNQQVGKNSFSLSCTYTQLCYLQLSVFIFLVCCGQDTERVKIPVIMELMRYILLAFLALHIWEFIYLPLAVCHLCHHTLSCSYCVHRCFMVGRECFPLPEPTFLPSQSFSTTFKNMFNFLKVITIYLGRI